MKKRLAALALALCLLAVLIGCAGSAPVSPAAPAGDVPGAASSRAAAPPMEPQSWQQRIAAAVAAGPGEAATGAPDDGVRTWYEVFVYSFCDGNGDGIGDLPGLISQLDYIRYLGFSGIWLMPLGPSPSYHKYDVADYCAIDPQYGTMEDFERLLAECEARGIAVIIDLVLNHTSVEHEWFQSAVRALEAGDSQNPFVGFYNFAPQPGSGN